MNKRSLVPSAGKLVTSLLPVLVLLLATASAEATTYTVNNQANGAYPDDSANDQRCSLREAVVASNTRQAVNPANGADCAAGSGNDVINLPSGQIALNAPLDVSATVQMVGVGAGSTIITASLLNDHAIGSFGNLTFSRATLVGGTTHFTAGFLSGTGGALQLVDARVTNFTAAGIVGQSGTIQVTNSVVDFNVGGDGGGIALSYASLPDDVLQLQLVLDRATIRNNHATANGGGVFVRNVRASISASVISDNEASDAGGGLFARNAFPGVADATIANNTSFSAGGGIALDDNSSTGNFDRCLIANNSTQGDGGGIFCRGQQVHTNVTIHGNSASRGGGVFHEGRELHLRYVTVTENDAGVGGGLWFAPV